MANAASQRACQPCSVAFLKYGFPLITRGGLWHNQGRYFLKNPERGRHDIIRGKHHP